MTMKHKKLIKLVSIALLIALLSLGIAPIKALGEPIYREIGRNNHLIIEVSQGNLNTDNLNPGDKKEAHLRLTNKGPGDIILYIRTKIIKENTLRGAYLADILRLNVKDSHNTVYDGTFRDADQRGNIRLGTLKPGSEKILGFNAELPGAKTGNEYQGASMKVIWIFTVQTPVDGNDDDDDSGGGDNGGSGDDDNDDDSDEGIIIIDEEDIFTPPVEPITIEDEDLPWMPKTGEAIPYTFYIAGIIAIITGMGLLIRKTEG